MGRKKTAGPMSFPTICIYECKVLRLIMIVIVTVWCIIIGGCLIRKNWNYLELDRTRVINWNDNSLRYGTLWMWSKKHKHRPYRFLQERSVLECDITRRQSKLPISFITCCNQNSGKTHPPCTTSHVVQVVTRQSCDSLPWTSTQVAIADFVCESENRVSGERNVSDVQERRTRWKMSWGLRIYLSEEYFEVIGVAKISVFVIHHMLLMLLLEI